MQQKFLTKLATIALGAVMLIGFKEHAMAQTAAYDLSAESNQKYLDDNAAKPGVIKLPSGLQYRVIKSGNGKGTSTGEDLVTVTYKGWLINGHVFDQTQPGKTATFPAGNLIKGWVQALSMMKEGDEWELTIPSRIGYGAMGAGAAIPPNQTLVFDMQLISVKSPNM
ncbi:MAG TPA: FKBP-type peptidyl-prolyl cis-trans isomerase [Rhizomicrobium sp.]